MDGLSGFEQAAGDARVVLCMIVRNEAAIVRRCLEAALPHVDGFVVSDTGSTDETAAIVSSVGAALGVAGRVVCEPFRDFGHNRTLAARAARDFAVELGFPLERTYLLFLDADMILHVEAGFSRRSLQGAAYLVRQEDAELRYYNTRLACLSHVWRAEGVTHEYWTADGAAPEPLRLESIWIEDRGDGGCKADKLERDLALLEGAVAAEPNNARYLFYLAQTHFCLGRWDAALTWYERRIAAGGWEDERWYARFKRGQCLLQLGEHERAAGALLDAHEERPARAEPLHGLARHYRERGKNALAFMLARRGVELPLPHDESLFVEKTVYEWRFWEELMISAFYVGGEARALGASACRKLLARRGHEPWFYEYVLRNSSFYASELEWSRRGLFSVSKASRARAGTDYACSNPTVASFRGRLWINVRLVNYVQKGGREYLSRDRDGVIRTRNVAFDWDSADGTAGVERELEGLPPHFLRDTRIQGLEDMRWVVHDDRVWFSATTCQVPGHAGTPRVVLGRLSEDLSAIEHLVPLRYERAAAVEKNWVLWSRGDGLFAIYSYDPFVLLRIEPDSGATHVEQEEAPAFNARTFRGSASPVAHPSRPGRFVALVHEVARRESENVYLHRFVELDDRSGLIGYGDAFVFDHHGIEYGTGLCALPYGVIVTYGHEDREARWVELGWDRVLSQLAS
jgi:glycosyltransferase involved in cell wall biosynthesis